MDKGISPDPATLPEVEIAALAQRFKRANGPLMKLVNLAGSSLEGLLAKIPAEYQAYIETVVSQALEASYGLASKTPEMGSRSGMAAVLASGAAGGAGGLATAIAELPVTVTLILKAIRAEARAAGFDPDVDWVRAECLRVFGAGTPLAADDGVNTSFLTARLAVSGQAIQGIIAKIAPKLATALGPKLVAQSVPALGAISGATLNGAFLGYYREIARIRFTLLKLSEEHGTEAVLEAFRLAVTPPRVIRA